MNEHPVAIHWDISSKLNFASHQSSFPTLRDLRIGNRDETERQADLIVFIDSDPPFLTPKQWSVDRIDPSGTVVIRDRDVHLDGRFLLELADAMQGSVRIRVEKEGRILTEDRKSVELLAHNEWGGCGYMPELLAAFSLPNDPSIDRILHTASILLRRAGKDDAINGYASGRRQRVWEVVSAIYSAIANLGLTYAVPPASFERDGQKIRLPNQILDGKVATCLDTTMLFAAAFEQAGLNPVIALPQGHALVGVWLQPEELSTIVIEEPETLRKRAELKEMLLIETTLVTSAAPPPMTQAFKRALETLAPELDGSFLAAVDIRRARAHQITPLALRIPGSDTGGPEDVTRPVQQALEEAPALPDFDTEQEEELPQTPDGRLERWQRKLLDLSARNPLLNHKSTKTSLVIHCPDPGLLEDKLAAGSKISIQAVPRPTSQPQDEELHQQRTGTKISDEYALEALEKQQILVDLPAEELSRRAVEIYRRAKTALNEGGANTLYLALGFLSWKRDERDERRFRAPLILLPVTLQRRSVRSGFKLLAHDDEPRFNTTLLEMLRKDYAVDIKGLDEKLPEDHSGIDVKGIWETVRRAVKDVPGFEVVTDVVLGHFSFAKYLMWKDLVDRTDALLRNPIVDHLINTPRDIFPSDTAFVVEDQLDRDYGPEDLMVPLPADSSQTAAIASADRGKDFIIIGPPGTGKSQTISNMIAHLLGKGKTVLFVSEKTAALEVVHRRLEEIDLGRFCLQLHSNKARKADVLRQLGEAWDTRENRTSEEWTREAQRLKTLRDRLNRVVDYLHTKRANGLTPHQAIGRRVRDRGMADRITFDWPRADQHDEAQLDAIRDAVDRVRVQAQAVGAISDSPFELVETADWSPRWQNELIERAVRLSSAAQAVGTAATDFLSKLDVKLPDRSLHRLNALSELAEALLRSHRRQTAFAFEAEAADVLEALREAVERLKNYHDTQSALSVPYNPLAWRTIDGEEIERAWRDAEAAWWPKRILAKAGIVKRLRKAGASGKPQPAQDAKPLAVLRRDGEAIDGLTPRLSRFEAWTAHDSDPAVLYDLLALGTDLRRTSGVLVEDMDALMALRRRLRNLLDEGNDMLADDMPFARSARAFLQANEDFLSAVRDFEERADGDVRASVATNGRALEDLSRTAETISERREELHDWCAWRRRRQEALDQDIAALIDGIEQGRVPLDEIPETFEAAYCAWWTEKLFGEDEILQHWSTPEHRDAIEKFQAIDEDFQKSTAAYIAAQLSGAIPDQQQVGRDADWGLIRKLTQQQRPRMPIRQIMNEASKAVTTLAPCLMMSPLSVAQYLPTEQAPFDVIIFDEASQLAVWDAVGAIARGRQTIIAGDPKQMPPTNFFARADDDPDGDINLDGDLESILDELRSASVPEKTLNLHYRSRRESLIAFSNAHYYDNSLITFPAPVHPDCGVRLVKPEGFYARGAARHNQGEAKAIVAEIVRRLNSEDPAERQATIGVVTFNSEQQSLIEDLLDKARNADPGIEWAFADDTHEPVFVKNLETVQGDERDVILFSVTYGPDQSGHVTMNFGPLNREGGQRRLNVALTRARSELLVFSTLSPERIDLSHSNAEAVRHLKYFLEYAERGPNALGASVKGSLGDFESPFEIAVARALRGRGWQLHPQVGVSAYRIDIGIVHPDAPGAYLAGVECDGAMYHSSAFARERDKIRQGVLENLGWTLFRVWSTDWWLNEKAALDAVDTALREHLDADRENRRITEAVVETAPGDAAPLSFSEPFPGGDDDTGAERRDEQDTTLQGTSVDPSDTSPTETGHPDNQEMDRASHVEDETTTHTPVELPLHAPVAERHSIPHEAPVSGAAVDQPYLKAELETLPVELDTERLHDPSYDPQLAVMIDHVVDREGPVHQDVLVRRVARHHGLARARAKVRERVLELAKRRRRTTREEAGIFFWPEGMSPTDNVPSRHAGRDEEMRRVEFIALEELRAMARSTRASDARTLAKAIGISRLTAVTRERLERALADDD